MIGDDLDHAQTGIRSLSLASHRHDGPVPWTYRAKPVDFLWRRGSRHPIRSVGHRVPFCCPSGGPCGAVVEGERMKQDWVGGRKG
ncbi:MAG: hypothetical protein BIP78_1172 [Candidatus Bipolaricaulis sibiricus]|uniref:Uncharacterized protein n=1 Tax=Bipolaricaulis sibiricus TaxID=2501609 RepID=A0A410FVF6_BIPS1|nr:MAG: hypothetical protein BIP78_1172 [Candidatus Bipolaricaulis sibiricus]